MSAHYRVKEYRQMFTPQRRVLGVWVRLAEPQPTMEAANRIIRSRLRARNPIPAKQAR